MKTDKQLFKIFEATPEWLFQLTGLESPGKCSFQSFTVKALERDGDGLVVPDDPAQPLTVVEFQFQKEETVYVRATQEMCAAQLEHNMRPVQGIIFFRFPSLDPQTEPWRHVIHAFLLRETLDALERKYPGHPLVAVFKPVLITSPATLEAEAVKHFHTIARSDLDDPTKSALIDVFVSWMVQRLRKKPKQEIEAMLLGELPDLEDTQAGKDLIQIGEERGEKLGVEKSILALLERKHGTVSESLRRKIGKLSVDQATQLLLHTPECDSLEDVKKWLRTIIS